jgi:hypothetical protein
MERTCRFGRAIYRSFLVVVCCVAVLFAILFHKAIMEKMLPDQTRYAEGYSEEGFKRITIGMTEHDVLSAVGKPLRVREQVQDRLYESNWSGRPSDVVGTEVRWWTYSAPGRFSESYEVRSVKFSPSGRVIEVLSSKYND